VVLRWWVLALAATLAACGQRGPLKLPPAKKEALLFAAQTKTGTRPVF
jgi:predicted small lipoprotein YifL